MNKKRHFLKSLLVFSIPFLLCWACYPPSTPTVSSNQAPPPKPGVRVPAPSPGASVTQVVGVTKISIDYSSPGVKGREIWGELEPYDKAWRAGANAATKITFEDNVVINGKEIKAGSYSVFITPRENNPWTIHINKGSSVFAYNKDGKQDMKKLMENDAVSVNVTPEWTETLKERLAYYIEPIDESEALVTMNWGKAKVSFNVQLKTFDLVAQSIKTSSNKTSSEFRNAANYYMKADKLDKAADYIEKSITLRNDHFWNTWIKSQILYKQNQKEKAISTIKKAISQGEATPDGAYNFFKDQLKKHLQEWESQ